jgi:hypothetical protein
VPLPRITKILDNLFHIHQIEGPSIPKSIDYNKNEKLFRLCKIKFHKQCLYCSNYSSVPYDMLLDEDINTSATIISVEIFDHIT